MRKSERTKSPHERRFSLADFQALVFKAAEKAVKKKDWDAFWVVVSAVVAGREYDAAHKQLGWTIGNIEFLLKPETKPTSRPKKTRAQAKADPRLKRLNAKRTSKTLGEALARRRAAPGLRTLIKKTKTSK